MHNFFRRFIYQQNKYDHSFKKKEEHSLTTDGEVRQVKKIDLLQEKTSRIIYHAKALFPFDFFPDEIIIDEVKITVRHHFFFATEKVETIMIEEIQDVSITTAIFIAKVYLKRVRQGWDLQPFSIGSLSVKDAKKIKCVILGLLIARSKGVDLSSVSAAELSHKLEDIGKASEEL